MKFFALLLESTGQYVKNLYPGTYQSSPYIYVVSSEDILKCKRYKTFKAAQKDKDQLDSYYESRGDKVTIKVLEIDINIETKEIC